MAFEKRADPPETRRSRVLRWAGGVCLAFSVPLLTACGGGDADGRTQPAGAEAYGGTVVVAGPGELDFLNPILAADAFSHEVNRFLLYAPLLRYGPDLTLEPWLAKSWTTHGDTAVTFELRNDVYWHDGRKTTAHDVRFTLRAIQADGAASPAAASFADWTGVEVVDSFTVVAKFRPHADPLAAVALFPIAPAHLLDSIPPERLRHAGFNKNPVGNGPFRFVAHTENDRWVFEANPAFPAELGGRPYVDRFVWRIITERTAQVTELLTERADVILIPPADQFAKLGAQPGVRPIVRPSFKYTFIGWNGKRAPFDDANVRRALTLAIDRARMLQALRDGRGDLAVGPLHREHWAFDDSLEPLPHDPAQARRLLADAGLNDRDGDGWLERPDGRAFSFQLSFQAGNDFTRNMAELVQSDLAKVGVRVNLRALEWTTLVTAVSTPTRDFDAALMGWEADFRVDLHGLFHAGEIDGPFQMASYRSPAVSELLDRVARTTDRQAALPLYHALQRQLRDDQPWTFLYYYPDLILTRDRLDLGMDIRGVLVDAARWRFARNETVARN